MDLFSHGNNDFFVSDCLNVYQTVFSAPIMNLVSNSLSLYPAVSYRRDVYPGDGGRRGGGGARGMFGL